MKSQLTNILIVSVALVLTAGTAAHAAKILTTSVIFASADRTIVCQALNISPKNVEVDVQIWNATTLTKVDSSGPITILPGFRARVAVAGPQDSMYCRVVGASGKKVRASLNVFDSNGGDTSDAVVVPAR